MARDVVQSEGMTPAGRVNVLGMVGVFLFVVAGGVLNLVEALVHTWDQDYSTGFPSVLSLVVAFGSMFLLCVLMLAAVDVLSRRSGDH